MGSYAKKPSARDLESVNDVDPLLLPRQVVALPHPPQLKFHLVRNNLGILAPRT